jgi:programmed cell death 6-interacting protein
MAIATVPKRVSEPSAFIGEGGEFGRPLFAQLVPFVVHEAASIYEERRDRLVSNFISKLESLTAKINDTIKSLNLPEALRALDMDKEEVKQRLQTLFADRVGLKIFNNAVLSERRRILHVEMAKDKQLQLRVGPKLKNSAHKGQRSKTILEMPQIVTNL